MSANQQTRRKKSKKSRSDLQRLTHRFMGGLLRSLFLLHKPARSSQAGFVLPTTVLLLLMVTLTAGAISFRSFNRTQTVIAQREQEVIVGAATPAVDRAKAKIEYLFARDSRFPGGLPTSNKLQAMMRNVTNLEANGSNNTPIPGTDETTPPYTLPDETRLDLNRDGTLDNAWSFATDIDGNGQIDDNDGDGEPDEIIVYSVIMDDAQEIPGGDPTDPADVQSISDPLSQNKANALVNRNAPIDTTTSGNACPVIGGTNGPATGARGTNNQGWEILDNVNLLKNFQIDVFVTNNSPINRTVSTLEFQQVRQAVRGNKWGAWFRNDLEIFPGPNFTWNGAMHTEGSVFLGNAPNLNLISAYASCLYPDPSASEITLASNPEGGFQGQFVVGKLGQARDSQSGYGPDNGNDPTVDWSNGVGNDRGQHAIDETNDSVDEQSSSLITDIALDPIQIFTADISVHRVAPGDDRWTRWDNWENSPLTNNAGDSNARVIEDPNSNVPFLDDLYRADNRYGPKASYNSNLRLSNAGGSTGVSVGTDIPSNQSALVDPVNGLDGYWERQAIREGLRIIGGERIELGNSTIWKGAGTIDERLTDPLYPYYRTLSFEGPTSNTLRNDQSIRLHRLSLRDNLAAVQGMAVYHAANPNGGGDFPLMCMSMTSHPGTPATISRSTSFNNITIGTATTSSGGTTTTAPNTAIDIDFFNGFGTNGWEYAPPMGNVATFTSDYNSTSSALRKSLENLAHFAGDPLGGAPSFTPVQDEHVHPYPTMSMWGDFSHLRRLLDAGTAYADLSPADRSYLHTAACTMGMLSESIDQINSFNFGTAELDLLVDAIGASAIPDVSDPFATTHPSYANDFDLPTSPYAYVSTLQTQADNSGLTADERIAQLARIFHLKYQISRDRQYGFAVDNNTSATGFPNTTTLYTVQYGTYDLVDDSGSGVSQEISNGTQVRLGIDVVGDFYGSGLTALPTNDVEELKFLRLAALSGGLDIASSSTTPSRNAGNPQFPSLFYLFPQTAHNHGGTDGTSGVIPQPDNEMYINDFVNVDADSTTDDLYVQTQNTGYVYQVLSNSEIRGISTQPRATGSWVTPIVTPTTNSANTITVANNPQSTLLLDKGYMNGRELMSSRVIDIDINLATTTRAVDSDANSTWIAPNTTTATGGIVYAFREDAKREDATVRPLRTYSPNNTDEQNKAAAEAAWTACSTDITSADCLMQFDYDAGDSTTDSPYSQVFDPPLRRESGENNTYISPKPVDYFADPARRPHGFRLSNGSTLNRATAVSAGMSFVSDNVVLIKGDFNLHENNSDDTKEEFDQLLTVANNGSVTDANFYSARTDRSTTFANLDPSDDRWRPVEIVGDAVIIVSDNFNDGAISDAFTLPRGANTANGTSSYQNYLRPIGAGPQERTLPVSVRTPSLFRENPYDGFDANANPANTAANTRGDSFSSPVKVWRDANFRGEQRSITGNLLTLNNGNLRNLRQRDRIPATTTTINALIITGVVPSRGGQSNGGLHNHPRFIEHWDINNVFMKISGGFFQLNYSTSATAPFDQKANVWEPTTAAPTGGESISYYGAPRRVWGYDVALQFVPAGPVSNRFITIGNPRSEYYQELPADDPYIVNLQCAEDAGGNRKITNPTVTCPT